MTVFSDTTNKVIDKYYIQALEDDQIGAPHDVIEKAKQGNTEAIHTIGCAYLIRKDNEKARKWLGTSAAMGLGENQLEIGCLYKSLGNLADNYKKAKEWFEVAANNGVKSAFAYKGDIYLECRDFKQALEMFRKSADLDDPYGKNRLGEFYLQHRLYVGQCMIFQDYVYAMKLFREATEKNSSEAQFNIGQLYEKGYGVTQDNYEALRWYMKSSAGGYKPATERTDRLNEQGYFIIQKEDDIIKRADQESPYYEENMTSENTKKNKSQLKLEHETGLLIVSGELKLLKGEHPESKTTLERLENIITKVLSESESPTIGKE